MTDAPIDDQLVAPAGSAIDGAPRIEVRYRTPMREHLATVAWAGRRSDLTFGIGIAAIIGSLGAIADGDRLTFWFPLLIGLAFVTGVFNVPFAWFAIRRQPRVSGAETIDIIDQQGIHERTPLVDAKIGWEMYREVVETRDMFYFVTATGVGFIPKRAFRPEQLETLRTIVAVKGLASRPRWLRRIVVTVAVLLVIVAIAIVTVLLNPSSASSAQVALSPMVAGGTVTVTATTDLPDGTVIALEVYQVDEYRRSISAGSPIEAETNPWVEYAYVEVANGTFGASFDIGDWPAGLARAVAFVSMHRQPPQVTDRFGANGEEVRGPYVSRDPEGGLQFEFEQDFIVP